MDARNEKRLHVRYPLNIGATVKLYKPRWFNLGRPELVDLGPVSDISLGGIAILYSGQEVNSIGAKLLSICIPGKGVQIAQIPFNIVTDCTCERVSNGNGHERKCGLQFGTVDDVQINRLNIFIKNYAANLSAAVDGMDLSYRTV